MRKIIYVLSTFRLLLVYYKYLYICLGFIFLLNTKVYGKYLDSNNKYHYNNFSGKYKNLKDENLPSSIDKDKIYTNINLILNQDLKITNGAELFFSKGAKLTAKNVNIYNKESGAKDIKFDFATLVGDNLNIESGVSISNSDITLSKGHINTLTLSGPNAVVADGASFKELNFTKDLGKTDTVKTGVGFKNITADKLNIDFTNMQNRDGNDYINRVVNFKGSKITTIDIKGYIDFTKLVDTELLKTNFNFEDGSVETLNYTDSSITDIIKYAKNSVALLNFKNTKITNLNASYNLMKGLSFNGAQIENFNLQDINNTDPYTDPNDPTKDNRPNSGNNAPLAPLFANIQFNGSENTFIKNFNLNSEKYINIQGEPYDDSIVKYLLGNIYILNINGYKKDTEFSFYNLRKVYLGLDPKNKTPEEFQNSGGTNDILNITYLNKISSFNVYNQTIQLNWKTTEDTNHTKGSNYLNLYDISEFRMINSLVDVTNTKLANGTAQTCTLLDPNDPSSGCKYDINFTYSDTGKGYGVNLEFINSGAIINGDKSQYVPLNIRTDKTAFVTATDMLSDLHMDLNGERSVFTLKSNKNNASYSFYTKYNYCFLKAVDGKPLVNCISLDRNYWKQDESSRVEQNWYAFNTDMLIVDPKSQEYEDYKNSNPPEGGKTDYATTWFTYYQPYDMDNPDSASQAKVPKLSDTCAFDQKSDGTGRGGFPCEFGNKIQVNAGTTTFLKPIDNLTVLEVVNTGEINFHDMNVDKVPTKDSSWITKLRMRAGILRMAKAPMYVDNLDVYNYKSLSYATFRPVFEVSDNLDLSKVIDNQRIVVNKVANFHNNMLRLDLYFNKYFLGLNQKITLKILSFTGTYTEKDSKDKDVTKDTSIENFNGVDFEQGLLFDTNYYIKDRELYVDLTRTKSLSNFIKEKDTDIVNLLDNIINKNSIEVDSTNHVQSLDEKSGLNTDTLKIINGLFRSKTASALANNITSLRPINNEFILNVTSTNSDKLLDAIKNSNNYSYESDKGKLSLWANSSFGSNDFSNTVSVIGGTLNSQAIAVGASTKIKAFKLGAFLGYVNSDYNSSYYTSSIPMYGAGIYSDITLPKAYFLKLSTVFTTSNFKGNRFQYFIDDKSDFTFKNNDFQSSINAGKTYVVAKNFFTPYVTAKLGYLKSDSYSETGGSSSLRVKGFSSAYYSAGVGFEYAKFINFSGNSNLIPKVGIAYTLKYYKIPASEAEFLKINKIDGSLNNIYYSSNNYDKNSLVINAGLNYLISRHSSLSSNFNAELINKDMRGYSLFLGYKYSF